MSILRRHSADIATLIPEGAALVEFGSGSSKKARILLNAAPKLAAYVPVDICGEMIEREAAELRVDFPQLKVLPVTADICKPFALPAEAKAAPARVGFFPGSTIGNFEPHEAAEFLRNAANILGEGATLIVGVDLIKPAEVLNAAYNDAARRDGKIQSEPADAHQPRTRRQFPARHVSSITPFTIVSGIASKCTSPA